MKKIVLSLFSVLFSLILVTPVFASEHDVHELEELTGTGEIIYMDDEITVRSFGNDVEISDAIFNHPDSVVVEENSFMLRSSVIGSGGRSSIIAADSGRSIYWSVKPATAWPYHFGGTVQLRYHSGFKRDAPIGGMGVLGSTLSGIITMNKNNGGTATLTGKATAINGSYYKVLPGVTTSFRAN